MKILIIGFSRSKKKFAIGSWLIRAYLKTKYSHTYFRFHSNSIDRDLVYEAVGSGVRFIGLNQWEDHAEEVKSYIVEITEEEHIEIMQEFVDNAAGDYGFLQNIGVVVADLLNLSRNPFNKNTNCSEIVARILKKKGYKFDKELNLLTPLDIDKALAAGI